MERLPHPEDELGQPVLPPEVLNCDEICPNPQGECKRDLHHLYYPRSRYADGMETVFRGQFKIELCRPAHEHLHRTYEPPVKPERQFMEGWLRGIHVGWPKRRGGK